MVVLVPTLPTDISVWSLGSFRLKGVTELMRVVQIMPMCLEGRLDHMPKGLLDKVGKQTCAVLALMLVARFLWDTFPFRSHNNTLHNHTHTYIHTHICTHASHTHTLPQGKARCVQRNEARLETLTVPLPDVSHLSCCSYSQSEVPPPPDQLQSLSELQQFHQQQQEVPTYAHVRQPPQQQAPTHTHPQAQQQPPPPPQGEGGAVFATFPGLGLSCPGPSSPPATSNDAFIGLGAQPRHFARSSGSFRGWGQQGAPPPLTHSQLQQGVPTFTHPQQQRLQQQHQQQGVHTHAHALQLQQQQGVSTNAYPQEQHGDTNSGVYVCVGLAGSKHTAPWIMQAGSTFSTRIKTV